MEPSIPSFGEEMLKESVAEHDEDTEAGGRLAERTSQDSLTGGREAGPPRDRADIPHRHANG